LINTVSIRISKPAHSTNESEHVVGQSKDDHATDEASLHEEVKDGRIQTGQVDRSVWLISLRVQSKSIDVDVFLWNVSVDLVWDDCSEEDRRGLGETRVVVQSEIYADERILSVDS